MPKLSTTATAVVWPSCTAAAPTRIVSVAAAIWPISTGGRRAGDRDEVVFGDPVALVSPLLGVLGEVDGVAQRGGGVAAFADRREVEDRQRNAHDGSTFA